MPDIDTALTGAPAAPAEEQALPAAQPEQNQEPAPDTEVETPEKAKEEKGRLQLRLNEITKARREAERRADFYQQQYEASQRQVQQPAQKPSDHVTTPDEHGYDFAEWGSAFRDQLRNEAIQIAEQRIQQQHARQYQEQVFSQFESREQAYALENPEYYERVEQLTSAVSFNPVINEILATSEKGPALVNYLATHLHEADQLSRLPPHIAAVQLGRIEANLAKAKPVTSAPPPTPTLAGGSNSGKQLAAMSYEEYRAARMKGK
jgi:hypothetical protein